MSENDETLKPEDLAVLASNTYYDSLPVSNASSSLGRAYESAHSDDENDETLKPEDLAVLASNTYYDSLPVSNAPSSLGRAYESAHSDDDEQPVNSPTETSSFHTAGSIDSSPSDTEVEEDDDVDIHVHIEGIGDREKNGNPPRRQVFDLPPGYESQPKLEVVDEYEPIFQEKRLLPEDSMSERLSRAHSNSSEPYKRRRPSIDIPSENTPLLDQNPSLSDDVEFEKKTCYCCIIL